MDAATNKRSFMLAAGVEATVQLPGEEGSFMQVAWYFFGSADLRLNFIYFHNLQ